MFIQKVRKGNLTLLKYFAGAAEQGSCFPELPIIGLLLLNFGINNGYQLENRI